MKRIIPILLAVFMVLSLAACGNTTTPSQAPVSDSPKAEATPASGGNETTAPENGGELEPLTIRWIVYNQFDTPYTGPSMVQDMLEERFNVTFDIPELDVHNNDTWAAWWASGEMADVFQSNNMDTYFNQFADQGIIRTIEWDWLMEYAPDWMENMDELVGIDLLKNLVKYKDSYWMMPYLNHTQKQSFIAGVRQSDLDAVGMNVPTTFDEYHDLALALSDKANNVYGVHGNVNANFDFFWAAYGLRDGFYPSEDGQSVEYARVTENYKEMLKTMQAWYQEGIIDPEYVTDTRDIQRAKWTEGKLRILIDHPWWFDPATSNSVSAMVTDQGEELAYFGVVQGPYGNKTLKTVPTCALNAVYFGIDASDEIVQRAMIIKNEMAKDLDLYVAGYYGEEGVTFARDAEGVISILPDVNTTAEITKYGIMQTFTLIPTSTAETDLTFTSASKPLYEMSTSQTAVLPRLLLSDVNVAYNERKEDLESVANQFYVEAVTTKMDIDASWDKYLADLNNNGYPEILEEYNNLLIK